MNINVFELIGSYPMLGLTFFLILSVAFLNGSNDVGNAVASAVYARCIRPKRAILVATIANFAGVISMFFLSKSVSNTIINIVDFNDNYEIALYVVTISIVGMVLWDIFCITTGIPNSESHAMISSITGGGLAALIFKYNVSIHFEANSSWAFTLYGLITSCVFGFGIGYLLTKLIQIIGRNIRRKLAVGFFKKAELVCSSGVAFMHGAQDGLKFVGVLFLSMDLAAKSIDSSYDIIGNANSYFYIALIVAFFVALGTSTGGVKVMKTIGAGVCKLEAYESFASDFTSVISLLIFTLVGFPVSTTQVKTFSIIGVGVNQGVRKVKWNKALNVVKAWLFTFPSCLTIAFLLSLLTLKIIGG